MGDQAAAADPAATPLAGPDRYATAALVARSFFDHPTVIGIADGAGFPDALAGGAAVARAGGPLVLTDPDHLPAATVSYLASSAGTTTYVFGGPAAVSEEVAGQIRTVLTGGRPGSQE